MRRSTRAPLMTAWIRGGRVKAFSQEMKRARHMFSLECGTDRAIKPSRLSTGLLRIDREDTMKKTSDANTQSVKCTYHQWIKATDERNRETGELSAVCRKCGAAPKG